MIVFRVAYGTNAWGQTFRVYDEATFPTLSLATKRMRHYKRAGFWSWVEDVHGNFIPVPGAKRASVRNSYPTR